MCVKAKLIASITTYFELGSDMMKIDILYQGVSYARVCFKIGLVLYF